MSGVFVAVVGPSGAGKDSVIESARGLVGTRGFVFPRRMITRPPARGEDHLPVSDAEFARIRAAGGFALSWRAHGLWYGIPVDVSDAVLGGDVAVVNVSRGVLAGLGQRFARTAVVRVTVPEDVRRERIARRGRETAADMDARVNRVDPAPDAPVDVEIVNDRALEESGGALADFLSGVRAGCSLVSR